MTSAYILLAAVLALGALIAILGDRLGSKVGKARLTILNLRPRQTATLITLITGILIAASTLGLLFGLSKSLRLGVFKLDEILREGRIEVARLNTEKAQILQELEEVKQQQQQIQNHLETVNNKFLNAQEYLTTINQEIEILYQEIEILYEKKESLIQQANSQEDNSSENQMILTLDEDIVSLEKTLQEKEKQQKDIELELAFLTQEIEILEQYYQNYQVLRQGDLALLKGQVLAFSGVKIVDPSLVKQVVDELLDQANSNVIEATNNRNINPNQQIISITQLEIQELINKIKDGEDYVVRIISGGNYLKGETQVRVFIDVALNEEIYKEDEIIGLIAIDDPNSTKVILQQQVNILLSNCRFRSRSAGVLGEIIVETGDMVTINNFVERLHKSNKFPDEIQAVAINNTSTIGPLQLKLIALHQGKILFSTS